MVTAPIVLVAAGLAIADSEPRLILAWGWLAIWGWAGTVVHGMLHRIVPFLIWVHWPSPLVGQGRLPTTRQLLPDALTRHCLRLHLATTVIGVVAISIPHRILASALGCALLTTALFLLRALLEALSRGRRARRSFSS